MESREKEPRKGPLEWIRWWWKMPTTFNQKMRLAKILTTISVIMTIINVALMTMKQ